MKTKISKKKTYWVTESHTVDCVKSFVVEANNTQEAIATYKKIKEKFPQSQQARNMDKNLARLGVYSVE